jgi:hypothetical protein
MAENPPGSDREPVEEPPAKGRKLVPPQQPEYDPVDEASEESFPASDAPSTWSREEQ